MARYVNDGDTVVVDGKTYRFEPPEVTYYHLLLVESEKPPVRPKIPRTSLRKRLYQAFTGDFPTPEEPVGMPDTTIGIRRIHDDGSPGKLEPVLFSKLKAAVEQQL